MATPVPNPKPPVGDLPFLADGDDAFQLGMDSYSLPYKLLAGEYQMGMNVINRGGIVQTRPGSKSMFNLPPGMIQGCTFFVPTNELPCLVFAVSGKIYASSQPFNSYVQLQNIQFNPYSPFISWASCIQSTTYDATGTLETLAQPINILIIQDGNTKAAYWDGTTNGHINPTPTPAVSSVGTIIGASNATPITITTAAPLFAQDGEQVTVSGVFGNTAANGVWTIEVIDATHVTLTGSSGNGVFASDSEVINGATNATPIVISSVNPLPITTGGQVVITGVNGNINANGTWTVNVLSPTTFQLVGSSGSGNYLGGGNAAPLAQIITTPTSSGEVATLEGYDGTPIGLWMVWSNNRLWVSRDNQVFASDIGNPLKFTEDQYLSQVRSFLLPDVCTGAAETPDMLGVVFFTKDLGVFLTSSNQNRSTWNSTADFQYNVFPNTGCSSPRSIVKQHGLLWWFTPKGLVSQNQALNVNITSRLDVQDNEMIQSKANISWNLTGICGAWIENYLFHAVPNGDIQNTRIHVLDQAPFDGKMDYWRLNSWNSYWTGWRPVEFARGVVGTRERVFCVSNDYDGQGRMWELFRDDKYDNGIPITCFIITKTHIFQNRDYKKFRFLEIEMTNIQGQVAVMAAVAGFRGAYQTVLTKDINAMVGQVYSDGEYGDQGENIAGFQVQTRVIKSIDSSYPSECNEACIESQQFRGLIDKGFSALICWSGIAGVQAYRIFAQNEPYAYIGTCEENETCEVNLLNQDGCGSNSNYDYDSAFNEYCSICTYAEDNSQNNWVSYTATCGSVISQVDADRKALATAMWYVQWMLGEIEP